MAYLSTATLKTYLGISSTADDVLLASCISRAQSMIDRHCDRRFEAAADTTRKFTVGKDTAGDVLTFDDDLAQITSIVTNADGGAEAVTLATTDYVTLPRNDTPYYGVRILASSAEAWDYTDDPENGITVTGRWAWSVSAPDDIVQACLRLAAWLYRQKDNNADADRPLMTGDGVTIMPSRLPNDVVSMLEPYRRRF